MDSQALETNTKGSGSLPKRRPSDDGVISVGENRRRHSEISQMIDRADDLDDDDDNGLIASVSSPSDNSEVDEKIGALISNDYLANRVGRGMPTELPLCYFRILNFESNEDNNTDDDGDTDDDEASDLSNRMPSLVSYCSGSLRSQSSITSNKSGVSVATGSCGIDFADDCSSIPSINTIKTFATTESEVATVKTRNFIPGMVTTQRERRWDECGGETRVTAMGSDNNDTLALFSPLTATPPRRKISATRRGHSDCIPKPTLRSND
jgi:hypothetical protein